MFNFEQKCLNKIDVMTSVEFGNLVVHQGTFLKRLALNLTKDNEEANDLVQDTYFKAISNREKYQPGTNIKGWLYTIMRNTFINKYRKAKVQNTFVDSTDNNYFLNQKEAAKETRTDYLSDYKSIMSEIQSVDKSYVDTFMMHYEGYKYEEIAEIMGIPLGTVKSRIFLARKKLMEKLKDYRY